MAAEFNRRSPTPEVLTPVYRLSGEEVHNPNVVKTLLAADGPALFSTFPVEGESFSAAAAQRLDPQQVEAALSLLHACRKRRAKLVTTGVGKSGIVARKIAATLSSIRLAPLDASSP